MDSRVPQKLMCHIRSATGYCLAPAPSCLIFRERFTWLYRRGFIWLLYIPRSYPGLSTFFNASCELHVQSESDLPGLWARKTSFRLLYKQDMEEFKQTLIHCVTSFFDNEDLIHQFIEDEDAKIEKRSLQVVLSKTETKTINVMLLRRILGWATKPTHAERAQTTSSVMHFSATDAEPTRRLTNDGQFTKKLV
ncbi:hypothetical protein ACE6H2_001847 [Prunus campanulata]